MHVTQLPVHCMKPVHVAKINIMSAMGKDRGTYATETKLCMSDQSQSVAAELMAEPTYA